MVLDTGVGLTECVWMKTIEMRLESLEKSRARWRAGAMLAAAGAVAAVLMAQAPQPEKQKWAEIFAKVNVEANPTLESVTAKRIRIVNDAGEVVAALGMSDDKHPMLQIGKPGDWHVQCVANMNGGHFGIYSPDRDTPIACLSGSDGAGQVLLEAANHRHWIAQPNDTCRALGGFCVEDEPAKIKKHD